MAEWRDWHHSAPFGTIPTPGQRAAFRRSSNFFNYMRQEFDLNALVEYGASLVNPEVDRLNPERLAAADRIKALRARFEQLQGQGCELVGDPYAMTDALAGFERFVPAKPRAKGLLAQIAGLKFEAQEVEALRADLPERVIAGDLERLTPERKLVTDLFKVIAYHVETELVRTVALHPARSEEEGRTFSLRVCPQFRGTMSGPSRAPADPFAARLRLRVDEEDSRCRECA